MSSAILYLLYVGYDISRVGNKTCVCGGEALKNFRIKILIIFKSIYIDISVYTAKNWVGNFPSCPPAIDALYIDEIG